MSGTNSKIRISKDNLEKLKILKNSLKVGSYEKVIEYLITFNMKGNSEHTYLADIKKLLEDGFSNNDKRTEAVHKRLGHLDKFYFTKILDSHYLLKEFLTQNLKESSANPKVKNELRDVENSTADERQVKLEKEVKEVWESHREIEENNQRLISKIDAIKNRFKFESGAFSKNYKAVLSVQDFEEIFK